MKESTPGRSSGSVAELMEGLRVPTRPKEGWLRAVREGLGMPRRAVAEALHVSDAAVRDYELAEVTDTITLGTLRRTARALGCDLVVALVPTKQRTFEELAANRRTDVPSPAEPESPPATVAQDSGDLESHLK